MSKTIGKYVTSLSNMLSVTEKEITDWVQTNNHQKWQLKVIHRQVWNGDIYIDTLRLSIVENSKYEITMM